MKAIEGVPFAGSYVDEAAGAMFGDGAKQGIRAVSGAMGRENPVESGALGVGGYCWCSADGRRWGAILSC